MSDESLGYGQWGAKKVINMKNRIGLKEYTNFSLDFICILVSAHVVIVLYKKNKTKLQKRRPHSTAPEGLSVVSH